MPNYWYDHVHLISPDPLKTAQFYERMFNAKRGAVRELSDGRVSVQLDIKGTRILIGSAGDESQNAEDFPKKRYGLEHFGLLTDNLEAAVAELKAKGAEFTVEIREARPGVKISFLLGPENVLIELLEISS